MQTTVEKIKPQRLKLQIPKLELKQKTKIFTQMSAPKFFLIGTFWVLISSFQKNEPLTKEQAIKVAEQFIVENGYTNLPAVKSKLSYELFDQFENNVDSILKQRYNSLQPRAFCIYDRKDSWAIGFLSTSIDLGKLDSIQLKSDLPGRAVIVMKRGKEIRIAHKDPLFSKFEKL